MRFIVKRFISQAEGALTVLGLFLFMACCVIGGLALDVANAYMVRTQLQATADAAAHAALYNRDTMTEAEAIVEAMSVVGTMLPAAKYGNTIEASDIQFGTWDTSTEVFSPVSGSKEAVYVASERATTSGNAVGTFFLRMAGVNHWDIRRGTVAIRYLNPCTSEGFIGQGVVDMQSNNTFEDGFCIHSNTHVEVNNGNSFGDDVVVSMPDKRDLVMPTDGFASNPGLQNALRDGAYNLRVLNTLPSIYADLELGGTTHGPSYITSPLVVNMTDRSNLTMADFTSGRVHKINCSGNQTLSFKANETFSDIVIVTDCRVSFGQGNVFGNVVLITSSTDAQSLKAASGLSIGVDDNCATGGGSQFITFGGAEFAANLEMHGGQLLALGDVEFAARADGINGASIISGGEIDGTSNATMGFCAGSGMEGNFESSYFRIAF